VKPSKFSSLDTLSDWGITNTNSRSNVDTIEQDMSFQNSSSCYLSCRKALNYNVFVMFVAMPKSHSNSVKTEGTPTQALDFKKLEM
jgi:hypothetical protein